MSKLNKNTHTSMDLAYQQINASIDELTAGIFTIYQHPKGDAESIGNGTYLAKGVGLAMKTANSVTFNMITDLGIGVHSTAQSCIVCIYTSLSPITINTVLSTLTKIHEQTFPANTFTSNVLNTIDLGVNNLITVLANTYIYVLVYSSEVSVTVNSRVSKFDTAGSPARLGIIYSDSSTPSTGGWTFGIAAYSSTAFKLKLRTYNDIANKFNTDYLAFQESLSDLEKKVTSDVNLPSNSYITVGNELNLWHNSLLYDVFDKDDMYCNITVTPTPTPSGVDNVFYNKEKCIRFKPTTTGIYALTVKVMNRDGSIYKTKTITINAVANSGKTGTYTIMLIGDSLVNNCPITPSLNTFLNSPADATFDFIGTKGSAPNLNEGIPGWTYAAFVGNSSPFYISGSLNFNQYLINNSFTTPDFICINLGINESLGNRLDDTSLNVIVNNAKTLITNILLAAPNCKIILGLPTSCSFSKDAFAYNYGVAFDKVKYMLNIRDIHKYFITAFDNYVYNSNVLLADTGYRVDRVNSYPSDTVAISQYNSTTEKRYINAVHPTVIGGAEIAMAYSSTVRALL